MKVDFLPLRNDAIEILSIGTHIDFSRSEFSNAHEWLCCTVRNEFGAVAMVTVFEFKNSFDAHVSTALVDPRALTRRLLAAMIGGVFQRAKRITALVHPENHPALQQMWRLGFKNEGWLRRGFNGVDDAVVFGLLPEDCPYLLGAPFVIRHALQGFVHPANQSVN